MKTLNTISLFDGKSCGLYCLKQAGVPVKNYYASEIDPYAIHIAKKNHPEIIHLGNVEKIHYTNLGIEVDESFSKMRIIGENIDLLIGGSPCQGFSFSGKQLNFDDPRSRLLFEYVRIKNQLQLVNPELLFMLENVNMRQEWQDIISELLGVQPIYIDSEKYSATTRKRLYWTNIPVKEMPGPYSIKLADIIENGYVDREKSYCIDANYWKGGNLNQYFNKSRRQLVFTDNTMTDFRMLTPLECERAHNLPDGYTDGVSNTQRKKMIGNGWECNTVTNIFKNIHFISE